MPAVAAPVAAWAVAAGASVGQSPGTSDTLPDASTFASGPAGESCVPSTWRPVRQFRGSGAWLTIPPLLKVRLHASRQMKASAVEQHPKV